MFKVKNILITGAAGFIGMHTASRMLKNGCKVIGIDNLNDYYDVNLKKSRLAELQKFDNFEFYKEDIRSLEFLNKIVKEKKINIIIHLAAQAGVRYSIEQPFKYTESNITGFLSILEVCKVNNIEHLLYASSSSVYGMNRKVPFSTEDSVDHPVSLYAATKKSNELMAHTYSHLFGIPTTGLRFFTVYGPYGRPDMAPWIFTKSILNDEPIYVNNNGNMERDFTYIDDIVDGIFKILMDVPKKNEDDDLKSPSRSTAPYKIFNIGNNKTVALKDFIKAIEKSCNKSSIKIMRDMQKGDVYRTFADITELKNRYNYDPKVNVELGIEKFVDWYIGYIKKNDQ